MMPITMTSKLTKQKKYASVFKAKHEDKQKSDGQQKVSRVEKRRQREEKILKSIEEDRVNQHTPKHIKSRLFEHQRNSLFKKIKRDKKEAKSQATGHAKNAYEKLSRIKRAQMSYKS